MPARVEERLDKLRRDVLSIGNKEGKSLHLVKWQTAQLHKQSGGLGIRNLGFNTEEQALWRELIVNKYGLNGNWVSSSLNSTYGTLMVLFPDRFSLCTNPEETVAEVWSTHGWNIVFRRPLNDWEIGIVAELLHVLNGFNGLSAEEDSIIWKHSRDGSLSVNKLYIKEVKEHPGGKLGPWKQIWRNKTEETNNHLFLNCRVTTQLWNLFLGLTHTEWIMPEHTTDLLSCWISRGGRKSKKKWRSIIPSCIWWSIWKERNNRCFENKANSIEKVKWNCLTTLYFWCKEEGIEEAAQILDFIGTS
ncbi:hypothetical protein H5410_053909 [Solanum commersonii]|uniref:Uncharacterized protein n=1 Tax=Solanum commersonii TaxID=4109 RepID=A0A9J5X5X1_SOLCO|nr:hypothetical protein H5410_053909 [Solanum commersonii]